MARTVMRLTPGRLALAALLPLLASPAMAVLGRPALADVTTASGDVTRSGWDGVEPGLDPATVSSPAFHQLYSTAVSGQVLGQPLVYKATVIVATQEDLVYGLDTKGTIKWVTRVGTPQPTLSVAGSLCRDITPYVGISTTPVLDPVSGLLYVTARTWDSQSPQSATWRLVTISAADGSIVSQETLGGAASNDSRIVFDPLHVNQRPALLLMNGWVYAAFGSFCDQTPYRGWVVGVKVASGQQTLWTDEPYVLADPRGAGIWQTGGLASDGPGRILLVTGNGPFPPPGPGNAPPAQLGDSVVRLAVDPGGTLSAVDFFAPTNVPALSENDLDLGSGGLGIAPVAFPLPATLSATHPHVGALAGKEGRFYLLDRDGLGGEGQGTSGGDAVVSQVPPFPSESVYTRPAFWPGDGGYIYFTTSYGRLRAFQIQPDGSMAAVGSGAPPQPPGAPDPFGFGSGAPVVTSSSTNPGSAVVWVIARPGIAGAGGRSELLAFGAVPGPSGKMPLLRTFPLGVAAKFSAPTTDQGRVYVATQDGHVLAFGAGAVVQRIGQGIILDGWGGLHAYSSATTKPSTNVSGSFYWPGLDIARGISVGPPDRGGYVVDGHGGVHRFGNNPGPDYPTGGSGYWPGWDIARGVATAPDGLGGYVLDGWGGVHAFGGAPAVADFSHAYWPGWDIARAITMRPDGTSGYVLDGWGGVHGFGGAPEVADGSHAYWPGWDIARGLVLNPTGDGGWILDGYGGVHAFGPQALSEWPRGDTGYWSGWDIARGITLVPGTDQQGYVLDGWGGLHSFGGAPPIPDWAHDGYWPGWNIARGAGGI